MNVLYVISWCGNILLELWQCRRTPTWLCQECCAHAHSSSQMKTLLCLLPPKAGHRQNSCFTCLSVQSVHCWWLCRTTYYYLDQIFGPPCSQHTATAVSKGVSSIFCYFTAVGVGTSVDNQLKYQWRYLSKNIFKKSSGMLARLKKMYANISEVSTLS